MFVLSNTIPRVTRSEEQKYYSNDCMNHKHQPTSTEKKREINDTAECLVIINDIKQDDDG